MKHSARHPATETVHPFHPRHVHVHDALMEREHRRAHGAHPLSFLHTTDHESAVLPEHGSHAQRRAVIERGRASRPSYAKAYAEHGQRMKAKGLLP
jgi:hypothetical protein